MSFSLSLLVLPLCLHKYSREVIVRIPRSYPLKTAEKNQQIVVGFADRVTQMLPNAFEEFGLLMERGCIIIGEEGRIRTVPKKVRETVDGAAETVACQKVARIVGKEFARISDRATVCTTCSTCSARLELDRLKLEFSANLPWLGEEQRTMKASKFTEA